jgi:hypothetical protein
MYRSHATPAQLKMLQEIDQENERKFQQQKAQQQARDATIMNDFYPKMAADLAKTGRSSPVPKPESKPTPPQAPTAPIPIAKPPQTEYIVVAGTQYDNKKANKLMFLSQSIRELKILAEKGDPNARRTWVIFKDGYPENVLKVLQEEAKSYGANIILVSNTQDLIGYINSGQDRNQTKVARLSLYAHGLPGQIAFGYNMPNGSSMALTKQDVPQINKAAFAENGHIASQACRTAMGTSDATINNDAFRTNPDPDSSLAQTMADHLVTTYASTKRTDYSATLGSLTNQGAHRACDALDSISSDAAASMASCKADQDRLKERDKFDQEYGYLYDYGGAIKGVKSGLTPFVLGPLGGDDSVEEDPLNKMTTPREDTGASVFTASKPKRDQQQSFWPLSMP